MFRLGSEGCDQHTIWYDRFLFFVFFVNTKEIEHRIATETAFPFCHKLRYPSSNKSEMMEIKERMLDFKKDRTSNFLAQYDDTTGLEMTCLQSFKPGNSLLSPSIDTSFTVEHIPQKKRHQP